jgi:hypothetical protein
MNISKGDGGKSQASAWPTSKDEFNQVKRAFRSCVFRDNRIKHRNGLRVVLKLAELIEFGKGYAYPSTRQLAEYTNVPRRSLERILDEIEKLEIFTRESRGRPGPGNSIRYVPNLAIYPEMAAGPAAISSTVTSTVTPRNKCYEEQKWPQDTAAISPTTNGRGTRPEMAAGYCGPTTYPEGVVVPAARGGPEGPPRASGSPSAAEKVALAAEHEEWFAAFPRTRGFDAPRGFPLSEAAYIEARRAGASKEELAAGRDRFAASLPPKLPRFVKYPNMWLQDQGWLEHPEPWQPKEAKPKAKRGKKSKPKRDKKSQTGDFLERAPKANGKAAEPKAEPAPASDGWEQYGSKYSLLEGDCRSEITQMQTGSFHVWVTHPVGGHQGSRGYVKTFDEAKTVAANLKADIIAAAERAAEQERQEDARLREAYARVVS